MTKFNKDSKTYGGLLLPAMEITEQDDADQYLEAYILFIQEHEGKDRTQAKYLAKTNLGYFAGYGNNEDRKRIERLFKCAHPIFGKAEEHVPTPEEAFNAGVRMGACRLRL